MGESTQKANIMDGEKEIPCIKITLKHQEKPAICFKVKVNCRLFKLLTVYCERQNLDYKAMRFFFDGARVLPKHTPKSLHMRDGDEIAVLGDIFGGGPERSS